MSRLARWVPLAAVVVLLGASMLAAVFANPRIPIVSPEPRGTVLGPTPAGGPSQEVSTVSPEPVYRGEALPTWLANVLSALCAVVILSIFATMAWMLWRDRWSSRRSALGREPSTPPAPTGIHRRVRDALDAGLAELDQAEADPRATVIACWVRLEQAAAAAGTAREMGDTSTDFVARLLAAHNVSGDVLAEFADRYREARFATHPVDEGVREQARAALRQVRDELAVRR